MNGSGSNLTVQLIKGNRTRVEQSTVTGIASGYDVFGGGATQDTDGVKDLSTGYTGGFAGLNDEGVLADDQTQVRMGLQHHEQHPRTGR